MPKIRKCRVRGCESTNGGVLRLFSFPSEWELAEKWKENLKISPIDYFPATNSFICDKPFEKEAIGPKRLKVNAVPTWMRPQPSYFNRCSRKNVAALATVRVEQNFFRFLKRNLLEITGSC
ncbi:uncharacterized protein LOC120779849 [Bactrocera tryoni]|uniref:uncharacterized protein LOC120779849 n=1 Tax=Bactrocera tryoni TaxID=59916 RepID=UPI001A978AC6|nr:uncharacterized protein LOC120779849 [Bactrocera tryoni]